MFFGKHYLFFGDYLESKYRRKILKLPINAGFGCPNRDGTLDTAGCVFCSEEGSASPTALTSNDISAQMDNAVHSFGRSFPDAGYIAYFQSFSNTYSDTDTLESIYRSALTYPQVMGLMIGTRPDCIDIKKAELIASFIRPDFELWIELGMQTIHESSLLFLNRHHTHKDTRNAIEILASKDIPICLHVILGIPGESWQQQMDTALEISSLPIQGIKIHHLHIIRNTQLEKMNSEKEIHLISLAEYIPLLCDFLERTRKDIIVHRIVGDRGLDSLIAPAWGALKGTIQQGIEDEFARRGSWQGLLID